MWFYTVMEFKYQGFSRHHGYFHKKENAIEAAEHAVIVANRRQKEIRERMKLEGLDFDLDNYPDLTRDMDEDVNHDNFMIWRGGHKEICIHMVKTDD